MTYLDALESELTATGIPARRRRRIVAEFADHLHEDPAAELGAPSELAKQFADELGTSRARAAAFRSFAALAFAGISLMGMFIAVGGNRGLTVYGTNRHVPTPSWATPIMLVAALAAQVALAAERARWPASLPGGCVHRACHLRGRCSGSARPPLSGRPDRVGRGHGRAPAIARRVAARVPPCSRTHVDRVCLGVVAWPVSVVAGIRERGAERLVRSPRVRPRAGWPSRTT